MNCPRCQTPAPDDSTNFVCQCGMKICVLDMCPRCHTNMIAICKTCGIKANWEMSLEVKPGCYLQWFPADNRCHYYDVHKTETINTQYGEMKRVKILVLPWIPYDYPAHKILNLLPFA